MAGFNSAPSLASTDKVSINRSTGFRSKTPDFKAINSLPSFYNSITKQPLAVPILNSLPEAIDNSSNDTSNDTSSQDQATSNKLGYINDYNNSIDSEENNPTGGMTQANIDNPVANPTDYYGNPIKKEVHGPSFNPISFIPGFGLMAELNSPAVPTSGYGTPGTYSSLTGNRFNEDSRGIDTITGQYTNEYGTKKTFAEKMMQDPMANILGDPDKAEQGNLRDMEYAAARSELASLKSGTTDPTGNPATTGLSDAAADRVATQLGLDNGFPAHTVRPGTATHEAFKTGRYVPGSQWSPDGKFSNKTDPGKPSTYNPEEDFISVTLDPALDTSNIDVSDIGTGLGSSGNLGGAVGAGYTNTDSNNNTGGHDSAGVQSGSQASHTGGYGGYADDAASSDTGGGK
jgi:hypothetical protein